MQKYLCDVLNSKIPTKCFSQIVFNNWENWGYKNKDHHRTGMLVVSCSVFIQSKYSFIHSKTKEAQVTPCETSLWVWSRCSVQKVCGFKCNQISKDSEVFVHHCLNLCPVYMKKKTRGVLKCYGSFYSERTAEWRTASMLLELFDVKQDQIILWELRQSSTYINIKWSRWTRALSSTADDTAK